jgi:hypothetical protein
MRRLVIAVLFALAGCTSDIANLTCSTDSDCGEGTCKDGICVDYTEAACSPECDALSTCVKGACVSAFTRLEIVTPIQGSEVDQAFEIKAQLEARDGVTNPWPGEITVTVASAGEKQTASATLLQDGLYQARIEVPFVGEAQVFASLGSVESAKVPVTIIGCVPACDEQHECIHGSCVPIVESLEVQAPEAGSTVGRSVAIEIRAVRASGTVKPLPAEITALLTPKSVAGAAQEEVVATSGSEGDEGLYRAQWTAAQNGEHEIFASLDRGEGPLVSSTVTFTVDLQPPQLMLLLGNIPHPANTNTIRHRDSTFPASMPFARRDEAVPVAYASTEPLSSAALVVQGQDGFSTRIDFQSLPSDPTAETSCPAGFPICDHRLLPLWLQQLALPRFRDTFKLQLVGKDMVGNEGASQGSLDLPVTRFKWESAIGNGQITAAPALSEDGGIFVATAGVLTQSLPSLYRIDPESGERLSLVSLQAGRRIDKILVADPGSSPGTTAIPPLVVTGTDPMGAFGAKIDRGQLIPLCSTSSTGVSRISDAALLFDAGRTYAIGIVSAQLGVKPVAVDLLEPTRCFEADDAFLASGYGSLAIEGNTIYAGGIAVVQAYAFTPPANETATGVFTHRALFVGDDSNGSVVGPILGPAGLQGALRRLSTGSSSLFEMDPLGTGPIARSGDLPLVLGIASGSFYEMAAVTESKVVLYESGLAEPAASYPVTRGNSLQLTLGADGTAWLVTSDGQLHAFTRDGSWASLLDAQPPQELAPTLDCSRKAGAGQPGRPGVLYVPTASTLAAVIVDSPGIDASLDDGSGNRATIWPKQSHDPKNTGNADPASLAPFHCPASR